VVVREPAIDQRILLVNLGRCAYESGGQEFESLRARHFYARTRWIADSEHVYDVGEIRYKSPLDALRRRFRAGARPRAQGRRPSATPLPAIAWIMGAESLLCSPRSQSMALWLVNAW